MAAFRDKLIVVLVTAILILAVYDSQYQQVQLYEPSVSSSKQLRPTYRLSGRYLAIMPLDGSVGRLGNFCFRYAAALGIAERNNMTLVLPDNELVRNLRDIFQITAPLDTEIPFMNLIKFKDFREEHWGIYDSRLNHLPLGNIRLVWSYTQSWKYFYRIRDKVRKELTFQPPILHEAKQAVRQIKTDYNVDTAIGVHVRRGDFLLPVHSSWGYAVATAAYFDMATKTFTEKYGTNIVFIVASDDTNWCKENINFHGAKSHYLVNRTIVQDLSLLTQTDHHLLSVGTFSWWSAWLGQGTVLYYKNFPAPGSNHSRNHNPIDYYPHDWYPLP